MHQARARRCQSRCCRSRTLEPTTSARLLFAHKAIICQQIRASVAFRLPSAASCSSGVASDGKCSAIFSTRRYKAVARRSVNYCVLRVHRVHRGRTWYSGTSGDYSIRNEQGTHSPPSTVLASHSPACAREEPRMTTQRTKNGLHRMVELKLLTTLHRLFLPL